MRGSVVRRSELEHPPERAGPKRVPVSPNPVGTHNFVLARSKHAGD